ncbi:MAG: Holliday junction resolvase RuvX [Bacteroidales bacterium]|nr:Holliday junction resolvase RuvX [Bacteroidales bacterium]
MGRIIGIDYGKKRTGLAVTDELQIIADKLYTLPSDNVLTYLKKYIAEHKVDCFVVGEPKRLNNMPSESAGLVKAFVNRLRKTFPDIPVAMFDERFTSKIATDTIINSGLKKMDRRNKELIDGISAIIILQSYLVNNKGD